MNDPTIKPGDTVYLRGSGNRTAMVHRVLYTTLSGLSAGVLLENRLYAVEVVWKAGTAKKPSHWKVYRDGGDFRR